MRSPQLLGRKERVSDIRNAHAGLGIVLCTASCLLSFDFLALLFGVLCAFSRLFLTKLASVITLEMIATVSGARRHWRKIPRSR
jgi:hypothetical protein